MNVFILNPDEFEVECELRNIDAGDHNAAEILQNRVLAEEMRNSEDSNKPAKMHLNAGKRPDLEIGLCRSKLVELQKDITQLANLESEQQLKSAQKIEARLLHVAARLNRATSSNKYASTAQKALQPCEELLDSLQLYLKDNERLNDSVEAAKVVNTGFEEESVEIPEEYESHPNRIQKSDRDEQASLMLSMMKQIQELSLQVATLSKQCSDLTTKPEEKSSSAGKSLPRPILKDTHNVHYQFPPTTIHPSQSNQFPQMPPISQVNYDSRHFPVIASNQPYGATTPMSAPNFDRIQDTMYSKTINPSMPFTIPNRWAGNQLAPMAPNLAEQTTNHASSASTSPKYLSDHRGLSRSGLSFDGSPTGIPINLFLFQLETQAASMNLSNEQLLIEVSFVLKGIASHWYWTFRQQNPSLTWYELRQRMMERFRHRRPDSDIENKIESRKQLPTETFLEFYQQIWTLTVQLTVPYSDHQLIKVLMKNMRPGLRYQLTDRQFETIGDLISSCTSWEQTWAELRIDPDSFVQNRRPPQTDHERYNNQRRMVHALNYDVPYIENEFHNTNMHVGPYSPIQQVDAFSRPGRDTNRPQNTTGPPTNANVNPNATHTYTICFNCDDIGHVFTDCQVPPRRWFCYKCGMKDTITPKCPRCAENSLRGPWRTGNHSTPRLFHPNAAQQSTSANTEPALPRQGMSNSK